MDKDKHFFSLGRVHCCEHSPTSSKVVATPTGWTSWCWTRTTRCGLGMTSLRTCRKSCARALKIVSTQAVGFFFCPYTLVVRCGSVSGIKPIWWYCFSVSRDYSTLPYLTIWHAQSVGVSDLCCLEHTEQSTSVTEIAFRNLPWSI